MGRVTVVGMTDTGPASLTMEARAAIDAAYLLCGGQRHLAFFPPHPGERFTIRANIPALLDRLRAEQGPAAVLASGDPCFYGIGPIVARALGERVTILPSVGSVAAAFARLGLGWQDATVLSAHGRPLHSILRPALHAHQVAILTDERNTPGVIAETLLEAGSEDACAHVFEHLDGERERHITGRLSELAGRRFASLNLLILLREESEAAVPLGLGEDDYVHRRGMITKAEVRAVSLAALHLCQQSTVWDIGAGCGSVAIEAAALAPDGEVYALERDGEQMAYLRENRRRFRAGNVVPIHGEAPGALSDLPDPDAAFVGGSGGSLDGVLRSCLERLRPRGRIVLNLVTLEHLSLAMSLVPPDTWHWEVAQVSVARSTSTAGLTRLAALNPVFIMTVERRA